MSSDLFEAARDAIGKSHSPYSKFPVGAAIRVDDGKVYTGTNIEVIAYPEGWCAGTTAIGHMVMGGGCRIREIAVIAGKLASCSPCGGCRRRVAEFADADTLIHLCDNNVVAQALTISELLPLAFDTEVLK